MSDRTADITVLIVAYKSRKTIPACLDALAQQTVRPARVLLLENGSPDGERLTAEDIPDSVTFIASDENLGFAGGNNRLARQAETGWIALLNPDAYPEPDWIEQLEAAIARYPEIKLFGSTQIAAGHADRLDGTGDVYHFTGLAYRAGYGKPRATLPEEGEVFGPCGAAALIDAALFQTLGGFDEHFFCYNEDVDLAYRARLAGHRCIQLRDAIVHHDGYGSSGRRSEFATYYGVRNRLWVFLRDTPGWLFWVMLPGHVAVTLLLAISSLRFGLGGVYARAIRDALKDWERIRAERKHLHATRSVSSWAIARSMSWNPVNLLTRGADVRPYRRR